MDRYDMTVRIRGSSRDQEQGLRDEGPDLVESGGNTFFFLS